MKKAAIAIVFFLFSSGAYGQPVAAMQQEEAIRQAAQYAQTVNPPMILSRMGEPRAAYIPNENAWIVEFVDDSPDALANSEYILRVEATSGKSPELLTGSRKERYRPYL